MQNVSHATPQQEWQGLCIHVTTGLSHVFQDQVPFFLYANRLVLPLVLSVTCLRVLRSRVVPVSLGAGFDVFVSAGTAVVSGVT